MKIFTDASLNDAKKTAGFSCICVTDDNQLLKQHGFSFTTKSVHFTELFAVRCAVQIAVEEKVEEIKIFSDSSAVLKKIQDYIHCLSKTQATLSQHDRKFLSKLESERVPLQKRILDDIIDVFEKNKNIQFTLMHVHGHQKQKKRPETEEEWNSYWNDAADKFADDVRQYTKYGLLNGGDLEFLSKGNEHQVKLVGDKPLSFRNVVIYPLSGCKEPLGNKTKEDRNVRVAHQPRRKQCCWGGRSGRGPRV